MFGQTFDPHDLFVIGVLVILEGALSIDNALVLGLLARRLPHHLQPKALSYGLVGALLFRFAAILTASYLLKWRAVKLLGGAYLLVVAAKHFFFDQRIQPGEKLTVDESGNPVVVETATGKIIRQAIDKTVFTSHVPKLDYNHATTHTRAFWISVALIELTDIAFAVDSIVAAIGIVGPAPGDAARHPKLWVIITGGMLGVILMRFAAVAFIRLLERYPRFETSAYLLVIIIGAKLLADWGFNTADRPHRVNFHSPDNWSFWLFWGLMGIAFVIGFIPSAKSARSTDEQRP